MLCVGVIGKIRFLAAIIFVLIWPGMQHSGIGGGGFMLVRDSNGNYESIGRTWLAFCGRTRVDAVYRKIFGKPRPPRPLRTCMKGIF